jgi:predicted ATP-grasp superfamily ATP-dependent carboligase
MPVRPAWREMMMESDAVWPIAPETDGILAGLTASAERQHRIVLASTSSAIALAASKHQTAELLARHGVPTVPTARADAAPPPSTKGWIVKPDDGAGGEGIRLFMTSDQLRRRLATARADTVVQPFVEGAPISLSMLAQHGSAWLLTCNAQDIRRDGNGFAYRGGVVGGAEALRPVLEPIAAAIAAALPELWGYVGVDLLATSDGPVVLEINPRLTTSYAGLHKSIGVNPATQVLRLLGEPLEAIREKLEPKPIRIEVPAP